jgi:hypothetical protein
MNLNHEISDGRKGKPVVSGGEWHDDDHMRKELATKE